MSDNVAITAGAGTSVATDDIGGVHYQRVKVTSGADGTANDVSNMNPLPVNHATTGIGHGVKTVTTAGTDEALASSTAAKWVTIQAQTDNTSSVAVGATGVDATVATGNGILLAPGESITLAIDNLADVYVDALVNGEGVRYIYGT
jgi:hypothetical protein